MAILTCPKCGARNRVDESAFDRKPVCGRCKTPLDPAASDGATANAPATLTDSNLADIAARAGDKPVLVDAWAAWCGPCRMIAPTIEQLARESAGRWVVGKLDVDSNPATAQRYRISSIPTLLVFKGGQLVDQLVGMHPKENILATLERHART